LAELHKASIAIKLDLRSTEEVNMQIKHASVLHKDELDAIKHLEIAFSVCMSTINDKPSPFTDEL